MQHRLYGESIPEALKDANLRGYFSSAQALPDYAEVLLHIKKKISGRLHPSYGFWRIIRRIEEVNYFEYPLNSVLLINIETQFDHHLFLL